MIFGSQIGGWSCSVRWRKTQMGRQEDRRKRTEEQERKNRNGTAKSGRTRTESKEQKAKNRRTGTAPTPRRTRTERPEQKDKNCAKEQKNRTTEQDQRTRPTGQKTSKDQAKATPAPSPLPHQGHPPRCLAIATNKTTNKTTNTEHKHSCCRPNCTRPFGPRFVVTSTIPPLTGRATRLFYFFFPRPSPSPLWGGRGRRQSNKQNKTMNLNISPPSLPQLVNKKKKKYIRKQHDNKTTHELQANLRAHPRHS